MPRSYGRFRQLRKKRRVAGRHQVITGQSTEAGKKVNLDTIGRAFNTANYASLDLEKRAKGKGCATSNITFTAPDGSGKYTLVNCNQFTGGEFGAVEKSCAAQRLMSQALQGPTNNTNLQNSGYVASEVGGYNATFLGCAVGAANRHSNTQNIIVVGVIFGVVGSVVFLVGGYCFGKKLSKRRQARRAASETQQDIELRQRAGAHSSAPEFKV